MHFQALDLMKGRKSGLAGIKARRKPFIAASEWYPDPDPGGSLSFIQGSPIGVR